MNKNNNGVAYIMLIISSIIFGFSFLCTKESLGHLGIFQLLGIRFLFAALIMTILTITGLVKIRINLKKLKGMLLLAMFQPLVYFVCETLGVKMTSASESGMMIALMPIAIALFSRLLLKEQLILRQWIAIFVSVIGVVLIIGAKGFSLSSGNLMGYMLLLGAVAAEGLYSPLTRKLSAQSSPYEITFVMMWVGAIVFNVIGLINAGNDGSIDTYFTDALNGEVIGVILYLSILSSIFAFFCYNYALSKITASKSASFANLTTVVSVLAGVMIGGEQIFPLQIIGMILIFLSIWGVVNDKKKAEILEVTERA